MIATASRVDRLVHGSVYLLAVFALASQAIAGAPGSPGRDQTLPHSCAAGPNREMPCTDDAQCPRSKCTISYEQGTFGAQVTLIVDDDVSKFDASEQVTNVVAATVLLDIRTYSGRHLLAQTYQNLEGADLATLIASLQAGPFLADTMKSGPPPGNRVTEAGLNGAVTGGGILDDFLFQEGDSELADALRSALGKLGRPVVARTSKPNLVRHADRGGDGLASVVQFGIRIRFVPV